MLTYINNDTESVLYSIGCEDGTLCHVILKPTTLNRNVKFPNCPLSFTIWSVRSLGRMMAVRGGV